MHQPNSKLSSLNTDWPALLGADCLGMDSVELEQLTASLRTHAPRCLRLHPSHTPSQLPFEVCPVPWHRQGYWLSDSSIRPGAYLQFAAADYYIQDAASMLALTLCRVQPHEVVCDLCAAPGGKASGLLEQLLGTGFLLANEVIQSRLALLKASLYRTRWSNQAVSNLDAERLAEYLPRQFDCVLVDAPCSGQSMVGRNQQSLAAFTTAQVEHSAARQQRIIAAAARLVRPGGRLVYSTCTFAIAENEGIIENFLNHNGDWTLDPLQELERWSSPHLPGSYRLWPHRDKCDGGFAAALRFNQSTSADDSLELAKFGRPRWQPWSGQVADLEFFIAAGAGKSDNFAWQLNDSVHLFCNSPWNKLPMLCHSGIEIAELHSKRIEPSYASSIVQLSNLRPQNLLELTADQAKQYVRGESISISPSVQNLGQSTGWCQVHWQGRPLSWGKYANGMLKNHFPKLLRNPGITMS